MVKSRDDEKDPNEEAAVDTVCILEEQVAKMFAKNGKLGGKLIGLVDIQEPAKPFAAPGEEPAPTKAEEHKLHPVSWSLLSMLFRLMSNLEINKIVSSLVHLESQVQTD